jgi:hypothetical protein
MGGTTMPSSTVNFKVEAVVSIAEAAEIAEIFTQRSPRCRVFV